MIGPDDINKDTQVLLQLAEEEVLLRTLATLTPAQRRTKLFKDITQHRLLSALRAGTFDNIALARKVFVYDPLFLNSKIVADAMAEGIKNKALRGQHDMGEQIINVMSNITPTTRID